MATHDEQGEATPSSTPIAAAPTSAGIFGLFGGRFVAETLMPLILELEQAYDAAKADPALPGRTRRISTALRRPAEPALFRRAPDRASCEGGLGGGAKIYFKRDELNHTGSHKINNCLGPDPARARMGKTRIIAETGAGQHGVAVATVCARFGLPCDVYMGATDVERQKPNVVPHETARRQGRR